MKVKNIKNLDEFFEVIDGCEGKVELITENGDCLDLKPKLCQFVALSKMFTNGNVERMEIKAEHKKDRQKLIAFIMSGN